MRNLLCQFKFWFLLSLVFLSFIVFGSLADWSLNGVSPIREIAPAWVPTTVIADRKPLPPSIMECDPARNSCVLVEYLLYRDKAVAGVYVNGVLSHCKTGFCKIGEPYTEHGDLDTPLKIIQASGCPDISDGVEALDLLAEYKAKGSTEGRYNLGLRERACNGMSYSSYWSGSTSYGYSMSQVSYCVTCGAYHAPTMTITSQAYSGPGNYGYGQGTGGFGGMPGHGMGASAPSNNAVPIAQGIAVGSATFDSWSRGLTPEEAGKRLEGLFTVKSGDTVRIGLHNQGVRHFDALAANQKVIGQVAHIESAMARAGSLHFQLDGMIDATTHYNTYTAQELRAAVGRYPEKTSFYLGQTKLAVGTVKEMFPGLLAGGVKGLIKGALSGPGALLPAPSGEVLDMMRDRQQQFRDGKFPPHESCGQDGCEKK